MRLFIVIFCLSLAACQSDYKTYDDFILHPEAVNQAIKRCHQSVLDPDLQSMCKGVFKAREDFIAEINRLEAEPESYGDDVMTLENSLAKIKRTIKQDKKQLKHLERTGKLTLGQVKKGEALIHEAEQLVLVQEMQLSRMYAVIRWVGY